MVLRTFAGTRGAVAATSATRLWCAGLANASATALAVQDSGLGTPSYVITGQHPDDPERGADDRETAAYIEAVRTGRPVDPDRTGHRIAHSTEAARTRSLGIEHVHPRDIELATHADVFDFAMEAHRTDGALVLHRRPVRSRP
ncbi:hypothetical protein SAMN04489812_5587 [Microlunatus soli]|uniref:Uncharacterized protein n=1 Tax=Microlunatus soli TaxID=630515 RepID=A0A1H2A0Q2_9ACTN|nr:hypothetical protein SAMN04489812_5587 [Microlunatus soli]